MNKLFVLLLMIFMHIIDDYKLQAGVLANLKQKRYWQESAPEPLYQYDYIAALIMHGLSWSFMIMLPVAAYRGFNVGVIFLTVFFVNAAVHAITDDLKANRGVLNLCQDQFIHMIQILGTAIVFLWK